MAAHSPEVPGRGGASLIFGCTDGFRQILGADEGQKKHLEG
jgi:hypothetical protein